MAWDPFAIFNESTNETCHPKTEKVKYFIKPFFSRKFVNEPTCEKFEPFFPNRGLPSSLPQDSQFLHRIIPLTSDLTNIEEDKTDSDYLKNLYVLKKIVKVLHDKEYDFHTVSGISKRLNISEEIISSVLSWNYPFIRKSFVKDKSGKDLFTLSSKPIKFREKLATLRDLLVR